MGAASHPDVEHATIQRGKAGKVKAKPLLEPLAATAADSGSDQSSANSAFARALGSVDYLTRERGVQALTRLLQRKTDITEADMTKLWKGLYFCFWHSDKAPVQVSSLCSTLERRIRERQATADPAADTHSHRARNTSAAFAPCGNTIAGGARRPAVLHPRPGQRPCSVALLLSLPHHDAARVVLHRPPPSRQVPDARQEVYCPDVLIPASQGLVRAPCSTLPSAAAPPSEPCGKRSLGSLLAAVQTGPKAAWYVCDAVCALSFAGSQS